MRISKAFLRIGIDARFAGPEGTGLGKYTEKLILNLAKIDKKNEYSIFLRRKNWDFFKLPQNFKKIPADIKWYSSEEQLKLSGIFSKEKLDLLHVPHFNVPVLYTGKFVVTIHDLIHHQFYEQSASTKNFLLFKIKRAAYKTIIYSAVRRAAKIIVPSNFVKNFSTPTLIITGEKDYRVSYTQSIQYFTTLQTLGIDSRLIIFKNDGHWPDAVKSMPLYYNAHLEWFNKYIGGDPAPYDSHKLILNTQFE